MNRSKTIRESVRFLLLILLSISLPSCGVPSADGPSDTYGLDFANVSFDDADGVVMFLVDGMSPDIFEVMIEEGRLPNIERFFLDRGLYVPRAVSNTPSVTLANLTSLVTGRFPGHHGVVGINWFDRTRLIWRNYETIAQKNTLDGDYTAETIYEMLPDRTTFSIFYQAHRGATKFVENWTSAGPPFFFRQYQFVDRLTLSRLDILIDVAEQRGEFPAFTMVYLIAPDFHAYNFGVNSPEYRAAMEHTDRQLGRVLSDMERAGLLDRIHVVLTSDHNMAEVNHHFHLGTFLAGTVGLSVSPDRLWESTAFEDRMAQYEDYSTVVYGSGDRYGAVCLRRPIREGGRVVGFDSWTVRPSVEDLRNYPTANGDANLLEVLLRQEAVDAVTYSMGENRVRVMRDGGEVEFRQADGAGGGISYHLISGDDPLGYAEVCGEMLTGEAFLPRVWLEATAGSDYPNLPAQILAYFRAPRAGDIAVFAGGDWDFNTVNRSGHGGLRPEDITVPLMIVGPRIAHEEIAVAQTIDLVPTILDLLGREIPQGLDGESLLRVDGVLASDGQVED
ncbi:MAG: alkaline phosphatase family protein [Sedimentisphaerales bacterium]|nr:alkaline phosphatase family protein [Sedimentisphaerales bacterium]